MLLTTTLAVTLFVISFTQQGILIKWIFSKIDINIAMQQLSTYFTTVLSMSAVIGIIPLLCSLILGRNNPNKHWIPILMIAVFSCIAIAYIPVIFRISYLTRTFPNDTAIGITSGVTVESLMIKEYFAIGAGIAIIAFAAVKKLAKF